MQIDGFRDIEFIDEGGLGRVFSAVRISTGGRVAIKEIKHFEVGSPAWHRARREVDALVRLKGHPHVVSVEEVLDGPDGPCLVMEFLDGGSVAKLMSAGPVDVAECLRIGRAVLSAVSAAHSVGVVHRDLKPQNVLLGSFGQIKVCDFGIAALARDGVRTQTSASTLAYASPEELDGDDEVGPPADVYSFCVTMVHLFTGKRPAFADRVAGDLRWPEAMRVSELARALASGMALRPEDRPSTAQLARLFAAATPMQEAGAQEAITEGAAPTRVVDVSQPDNDLPTRVRATRRPDDGAASVEEQAGLPRTAGRTMPGEHALGLVDPAMPPLVDHAPPARSRMRARRHMLVAVPIAVTVVIGLGIVVASRNSTERAASPDTAATTPPTEDASATTSPLVASTDASPTTQETPAAVVTTTEPSLPKPGDQLMVLSGHPGEVQASKFSPDGRTIATSGRWDRSVHLWDATTGSKLASLIGLDYGVEGLAFSPDGRILATSGEGGRVSTWSTETWELLTEFEGHSPDDYVPNVEFSPDGTELASASRDGTARVWSASTGGEILGIDGPMSSEGRSLLEDIDFSPDGRTLATVGEGPIAIWSASTGELISEFTGQLDRIVSVEFSPDGTSLVTSGFGDEIRVLDARTGEVRATFLSDGGFSVEEVSFSPDGSLVGAAQSETVSVWDWASGQQVLDVDVDGADAISVDFSPDGSSLLISSDVRTSVLDADAGTERLAFEGHAGPVYSAIFDPTGRWLATTGAHDTVMLWDSTTGAEVGLTDGDRARFAMDGESLFVGDDQRDFDRGPRQIRAVDTSTGEITPLLDLSSGVAILDISPNGRYAALDSSMRSLTIRDIRTDDIEVELPIHAFVSEGRFSSDGSKLVTIDESGRVVVWDAFTGDELQSWATTVDPSSVTLSLDDEVSAVAIVSVFGEFFELWDTESALALEVGFPTDQLSALGFGPRGVPLAVADNEGGVRVHDGVLGERTLELTGHMEEVWGVAISPDGTRLVSVSWDATIRIWNLEGW